MSSKDTNPKDVVAAGKANLGIVPTSLAAYAAMSFYEGMTKYGAFNWRHSGIKTSVYLNALERHLTRYKNGEDVDAETLVPHLASIIACAGIIIDATLHNKCTDDRADDSHESIEVLSQCERVQNHLRVLHAGKNPVHYFKTRVNEHVGNSSKVDDVGWRIEFRCGVPDALRNFPDTYVCVRGETALGEEVIEVLKVKYVRWNSIKGWRYYNG